MPSQKARLHLRLRALSQASSGGPRRSALFLPWRECGSPPRNKARFGFPSPKAAISADLVYSNGDTALESSVALALALLMGEEVTYKE